MQTTIYIDPVVVEGILDHAKRDQPNECCGILLGRHDQSEVRVRQSVGADNIADGDRKASYQIDWKTLFATVRATRRGPDGIVGFYHSHPTGLATPSQSDLKLAWVDYSYVIIRIDEGGCATLTSWRIPCPGASFERELLLLE